MIFQLPLPPKALSPNGRFAWYDKSKGMKISHLEVEAFAKTIPALEILGFKNGLGSAPKLIMEVDAYPAVPGFLQKKPIELCCPGDDDNGAAACKGYRDAIAKLIGIDDKHIRTLWTKHENPKRAITKRHGFHIPVSGCVVIELRKA